MRATSTSSGTGCPLEATFLRRCGGSIFRRRMAGRGRWAFRRSPTASPRKSPAATWSRSWSRCSIADSYGYRPGKSAIDAVRTARQRCWRYDWVLDLDIKALLRQHRLGADARGGPSSYGLPMGAALRRALAEGARADGGRQHRAAHGGNATGRGHLAAAGKPVPALRVRHVDGAGVSAHPVRALRGRRDLSLQKRRGGAGTCGARLPTALRPASWCCIRRRRRSSTARMRTGRATSPTSASTFWAFSSVPGRRCG